jgi:predicted permease
MFLLTLEQAATLLLFILLGYLLRKTNVLKDGAKAALSALLVNFFSPFYSLNTLSKQVSVDRIVEYAIYLLAGTLVTLLLIAISM